MEQNLWHQTIAASGRLTLFPDEGIVRRCVRALARVVRDRLLLFSLVDDHIHQLPTGTRARAVKVGHGAQLALRGHVASSLDPTRTRPVESRGHLRSLVDYFLRQVLKHELPVHPALWSGSCFLDLIGARVLDGLSLQLNAWLPRLRQRELYKAVGLPPKQIEPAGNGVLRRLGAFRIADAAAAALAIGPGLIGNCGPTILARASAASLAQESGISARDIADALEVTPRAIRRLVARTPIPRVRRAIRMRLALEEAVVGPDRESS